MLIVVSKAKAIVRANQDTRTSQEALERLSAHVSQVLGNAAIFAAEAGRKTVKAEDITAALDKT